MSEQTDYQTFKRNIVRGLDRCDRIENIMGSGMPDVNICLDGVESWIELKSPKEPARLTSVLFASNHKISMEQRNWMLRQRNAKGKAWILIATNRRWMLFDHGQADDLNTMILDLVITEALWHAPKPIRKDQWNNLRTILTSK